MPMSKLWTVILDQFMTPWHIQRSAMMPLYCDAYLMLLSKFKTNVLGWFITQWHMQSPAMMLWYGDANSGQAWRVFDAYVNIQICNSRPVHNTTRHHPKASCDAAILWCQQSSHMTRIYVYVKIFNCHSRPIDDTMTHPNMHHYTVTLI